MSFQTMYCFLSSVEDKRRTECSFLSVSEQDLGLSSPKNVHYTFKIVGLINCLTSHLHINIFSQMSQLFFYILLYFFFLLLLPNIDIKTIALIVS